MAKPKNSEHQAKMATQNGSSRSCNNCGKRRYLHWSDVKNGNTDCEKSGCKGKYT